MRCYNACVANGNNKRSENVSLITVESVLHNMTDDELDIVVQHSHFNTARASVIPSVSSKELLHYEKLKLQFSSLHIQKTTTTIE